MQITKNPQYYSKYLKIQAILPTQELVILTKFYRYRARIVHFSSALLSGAGLIFFDTVSIRLNLCTYLLPIAATNPELSGNKKTNPRRSSVSTPNLPGTGNVPTPVREKWKDNLEAKGT